MSLELAPSSVNLHLKEGKMKYLGFNIRDDDGETLSAIKDQVSVGRALKK
jgi:hypothetical protein